jgi:hypothetical protein
LLIGRSALVKEEKERHRKDFQRNLKNPLTNPTRCDTINTKTGEGKPHKPERELIMKKTTMNTILSLIATIDTPEAETVRAELTAELNRGAEKAQANRELYEQAKEIVLSELGDTPVTVAELYEVIKDKLPDGFTKAKVQYALGHYWESEVVKHDGKVNSYTRA